MNTNQALLDFHERTHRSISGLIAQCGELSSEQLHLEHKGFAYPTVAQQIQHAINAERYWIGVIQGRLDVEEDEADRVDSASLEALRRRVFAVTEEYLRSATDEELNTARAMVTWGGKEQVLVPARILIRTQTHFYQHQGQIVAMSNLMGFAPRRLDFPID